MLPDALQKLPYSSKQPVAALILFNRLVSYHGCGATNNQGRAGGERCNGQQGRQGFQYSLIHLLTLNAYTAAPRLWVNPTRGSALCIVTHFPAMQSVPKRHFGAVRRIIRIALSFPYHVLVSGSESAHPLGESGVVVQLLDLAVLDRPPQLADRIGRTGTG